MRGADLNHSVSVTAEGESCVQTANPTSDEKTSSEERKRVTERAYRRKMRRVKRWAEDVHRSIHHRGVQESGQSSIYRE